MRMQAIGIKQMRWTTINRLAKLISRNWHLSTLRYVQVYYNSNLKFPNISVSERTVFLLYRCQKEVSSTKGRELSSGRGDQDVGLATPRPKLLFSPYSTKNALTNANRLVRGNAVFYGTERRSTRPITLSLSLSCTHSAEYSPDE